MCLRVYACVRSRSRVFHALFWACVSHGEKVEFVLSSPRTGPPSSGLNKLPKADPSCLPSLPLSGDFHHSAEAVLCAKATLQTHQPLYSEDRSSLCIYHLFLADVINFDASCLSQEKNSPLQCHLPLSSLSVFIVWRSKNCLRSCCALTTPEPCRAFDCATISIKPLHGQPSRQNGF